MFNKVILNTLIMIGWQLAAEAKTLLPYDQESVPASEDYASQPTWPVRFVGQDRVSKKPCALIVHDLRETARGIEAIVSTEYRHGNETPGTFTLIPNNANSLRGLSDEDGKSELVLFFAAQPNKELQGLSHYHLRWWHINHHHNHACVNLKQP